MVGEMDTEEAVTGQCEMILVPREPTPEMIVEAGHA
jgi:hypothetical protein